MVVLANIRRETRIAALFPHTSVFPLPAFARPVSSRTRTSVRTWLYTCSHVSAMYTYVLGARGERTRSLRGVIRERRTSDRGGREKSEEHEVEEGRENEATQLEGWAEGYEEASEEEGHWDARNESLLVPRRNGALGRPDRRGTKILRVPARERGARIGQWKEWGSGGMRERERAGGDGRIRSANRAARDK